MNQCVLITGASGFIGSNLAKRILTDAPDTRVIGLDNMNDYYDVRIKEARLKELQAFPNYVFVQGNLADKNLVFDLFETHHPEIVVNLAAQAGVRYSIVNPDAYVESNLLGFFHILEACRHYPVEHLVYASSSSVYGANKKVPYSTEDKVDNPISLYAATKKSNELMAHVYSHLYDLPTTGLRFFTVYGPWGRPDMSPMLFAKAIMENKPIKIFNHGDMARDFTYVDDIVEGVYRVIEKPAKADNTWQSDHPDPASSSAPYRVYNIGNSSPVKLMDYVQAMETAFGKEAIKEFLPMQAGDVQHTFSDVSDLEKDFDYRPTTPLEEGLKNFANWYFEYFK